MAEKEDKKVCRYCKQEQADGKPCTEIYLKINGSIYERTSKMSAGIKTCGECGSPGVHHFECNNEICKYCGNKSVSCGCVIEGMVPKGAEPIRFKKNEKKCAWCDRGNMRFGWNFDRGVSFCGNECVSGYINSQIRSGRLHSGQIRL